MVIPHRVSQIVRFLSAGGIGVLLYFAILYTLTDVFDVWYIISAALASIVNYTSNFIFQKYWTFENKTSEKIRRQAGAYGALSVLLSLANLGLLYVLVESAHLHHLVAQVVVTTVLTVVSYLVSRKIFK